MSNTLINLEDIPNQIGTAILDLQGNIIKATGSILHNDDISNKIYRIIKNSLKCLTNESLNRIVVNFQEFSFIMTLDKENIYVVQVEQS